MKQNGELKSAELALRARGVRDVKLCFSPGVLGVPASEVRKHAANFLNAYLAGNMTVVSSIGDAVRP